MSTDCLGGVWTYSLDLVRALREEGVEVVLASMGARLDRDQRRRAESAGAVALEESDFRLEWMDDPWADVDASGTWLMELAEDHGADVVHLCSYAHGSLPWPMPTVLVAHSDVLSWWRSVRGEAAPPTRRR
jgi:glycogen(starch) synthase